MGGTWQPGVVEQQGEVIRMLERQKQALYAQVLTLQGVAQRCVVMQCSSRHPCALACCKIVFSFRRTAVANEEEATAITTLQRMVTAKDRELVALHAEKEALLQVQSGTWQLLDEREAEVHRLQVVDGSCSDLSDGFPQHPPHHPRTSWHHLFHLS